MPGQRSTVALSFVGALIGASVSLLAAALSTADEVDGGPPDGETTTCVAPAEAEPWLLPVTPLDAPPKVDKAYGRGWSPRRRSGLHREVITLFSVHSREAVPVIDGELPPDQVLLDLWRCRGFGTRHPVDGLLVQTLVAAARHFESPRVDIVSAFRSPKFNDSLSKKGRRVAPESRHSRGQAIDFSLVGVDASAVGSWLWDNFEGGVGTYRKDGFVHVDVGPKRRWRGR